MSDVIEDSGASVTTEAGSSAVPLRRPAVETISATATIVLILIAVPILVATRLPRWISDGIPDGLVLSDLTVIPAVVLFVYLVRGLIDSHQEKAIDLRPGDAHLRKEFSRVVERSHFGVGRAQDWTMHSPRTSLRSVDYDVVFDRHAERVPDLMPEPFAPVLERDVPPEPVVPEITFAEIEDYEVARGDSWWTLATDRLGDGRRWSEIRDLNVNRLMPDGTVLDTDAHLLEGFVIVVPVKVVDEDA